MSPLLLLDMHKCRPQITYSREGAGEDLGEGERPFLRKAFTPNAVIHCMIWEEGEEVKAKNEKELICARTREEKTSEGGALRRRSMYKIPHSNLLKKDARSTKKDGVFFAFPSLFCLCRADAVRNNPDERCTSPMKCLFL